MFPFETWALQVQLFKFMGPLCITDLDDSESDSSFGKTKKSKGRRSALSLTSNGGDLSWVRTVYLVNKFHFIFIY